MKVVSVICMKTIWSLKSYSRRAEVACNQSMLQVTLVTYPASLEPFVIVAMTFTLLHPLDNDMLVTTPHDTYTWDNLVVFLCISSTGLISPLKLILWSIAGCCRAWKEWCCEQVAGSMFINSDDYEWYCFGRILSQFPEFSQFLSQILANRLKLILP